MNDYKNQNTICAPFVPDEEQPYIFISYAHTDRERVFPIIKNIYEQGWRVWYDEGLELGEDYYGSLKRHIQNCSVFLLFASRNALNSHFITTCEIPQAYELQKKIVVFHLDNSCTYCGIQELDDAIHTDSEQLAKNLNEIDCLHRTQPRKAVGHKVQMNILKRSLDNKYEYIKCLGGLRITNIESRDSVIYIPEEYPPFDSLKVVEIDNYAFWKHTELEVIYLPNNLKSIDLSTFLNNKFLKDVYISANVKITNKYGINLSEITYVIHCVENSVEHIIAKESELKTVISVETNLNMQRENNPYAYLSFSYSGKNTSFTTVMELEKHGCSYILGRIGSHSKNKTLIQNCTCFVAFIDRHYVEDDVVNDLRCAMQAGKKIVVYQTEECELPSDLSNLQLVHQLRYNTGSEEERTTKLINWLTVNGCRDPYEFKDFEYKVTDEGIDLIEYTGKKVHPEIEPSFCGVPVVCVGGFSNCDFIESIAIPDGVSELGVGAFAGCKKLRSVVIPNSVKKISDEAFINCVQLNHIDIPNNIKFIGRGAFSGCVKLKNLLIPSHIPIARGLYQGWPNLKHIQIPKNEYEISNSAFRECIGLESVVMHEKVNRIGHSAFAGCINLKEIVISESVTEIGANAFSDCRSLKVIIFPKGLKKLCGKAFEGCTSLEKVIIPGLDTKVLMFCEDLKSILIYCTKGSLLQKRCDKMSIPYSLLQE